MNPMTRLPDLHAKWEAGTLTEAERDNLIGICDGVQA